MKKNINLFLLVAMLSFMIIPLTSSAPPFQTNINANSQNGLQIFAPQFEAVRYNTTFNLHIHVSNLSNGVPLPNTAVDCFIHLYSMSGSHLYESEPMEKDSNGWDLEQTLLYTNFTEHGEFNGYYIWCNSTDGVGGELKGLYEITANGKTTPEGIIIIAFGLVLILILAGSVVMIIKAMGHMINKDFDLMDLGKMWGMFFGLLGINQLAIIYLGNVDVNNWLDLFIKIYAFPMVIVPIIALILSIFNMNKQAKEKARQW
jgi:hypothetical protein